MRQKYVDSARAKCPEIPERVHPHLWRHTRAMHLYQHGMDLTLVSQWLGHANLETTLIYAYADTEHKRQAITRALGDNAAPGVDLANYTVNDEELLKLLYGLWKHHHYTEFCPCWQYPAGTLACFALIRYTEFFEPQSRCCLPFLR